MALFAALLLVLQALVFISPATADQGRSPAEECGADVDFIKFGDDSETSLDGVTVADVDFDSAAVGQVFTATNSDGTLVSITVDEVKQDDGLTSTTGDVGEVVTATVTLSSGATFTITDIVLAAGSQNDADDGDLAPGESEQITTWNEASQAGPAFSHITLCLGEPVSNVDVTLVKVWQDPETGRFISDPAADAFDWNVNLDLGNDTTADLTIDQDSAQPHADTTTVSGTAYSISEGGDTGEFQRVDCSDATRDRVDGAYDGTFVYDALTGTATTDTVHVICNTLTTDGGGGGGGVVAASFDGEILPSCGDWDGEVSVTNGRNPRNVPVRFEVREGDEVIDSVVLGAGQSSDALAGFFDEDSGDRDIVLVAIPKNGNETVLDSATVDTDCVGVLPGVVQPDASIDADCDGVTVTLDNSDSDQDVTYTVVINGVSQDVIVGAGETETVTGDLGANDSWAVDVSVGDNPVLADNGTLTCATPSTPNQPEPEQPVEVLPIVVEKPAPQAAPDVAPAAQELPATGFETSELFMLALLLMGLGGMVLLAPERRRREW